MSTKVKRCAGCKKDLPRSQFYKSSYTADGKNIYCKGCCKVNRALETLRKRPSVKSSAERNHIERAKEYGRKWEEGATIVFVYREYHGNCAICGKWVKASEASLDHKIPLARGGHHTRDNVQLTHLRCNLSKGASV